MLVEAGAVKDGRAARCPRKKQEGAAKGKEARERSSSRRRSSREGQVNDLPDKQKTQAHKEESTIRIEVKKLDELMNLAGELVLGKNRLILLNNIVKKSDATEQCPR